MIPYIDSATGDLRAESWEAVIDAAYWSLPQIDRIAAGLRHFFADLHTRDPLSGRCYVCGRPC
jgi:hypothetical protein